MSIGPAEKDVVNNVGNTNGYGLCDINCQFKASIFLDSMVQVSNQSVHFMLNLLLHEGSAQTKVSENVKGKTPLLAPFVSFNLDDAIVTILRRKEFNFMQKNEVYWPNP